MGPSTTKVCVVHVFAYMLCYILLHLKSRCKKVEDVWSVSDSDHEVSVCIGFVVLY